MGVLRLAAHFLGRACAEYRLPAKSLAADARTALLDSSWPGNVRELANVMERVALLFEAPVVTGCWYRSSAGALQTFWL